ncbi:hypothetical protein ACFL1K_02680 [Candidatus Omnitrophota bacterium]
MKNRALLLSGSLVLLLSIFLAGCAKYQGLIRLKGYGDSQDNIESYVLQQEKLFDKLKDDIKSNRLKEGVSRKMIICEYGEPVISGPVKDDTAIAEALLYRYPTKYFSTDKAYLYFSDSRRLVSWELITAPVSKGKE